MEENRIATPEKDKPPLSKRLPKLAGDFGENFVTLLRYSSMRNLEGFIAGLLLISGIGQFIPMSMFQSIQPAPLLWLSLLMIVVGLIMLIGAVNDLYKWRRRGCFGGVMVGFAYSALLWLSLPPVPARWTAPYFAISLMWLYVRIGQDRRITITEEVGDNGGINELDSNAGRSHYWITRRIRDEGSGHSFEFSEQGDRS